MVPVRFTALACVLLTLCSRGYPQDKLGRDSAPARSQAQPYIDWVPAACTETLVVGRGTYRIPAEVPRGGKASVHACFFEWQMQYMFDDHVRDVLAGKKVKLWLEAASRFRAPTVPTLGPIYPTSSAPKYDGCRIMVFDADPPLDERQFLDRLMEQGRRAKAQLPRPRRHRIEGHDVVAYVASHFIREWETDVPSATREEVDLALSREYWVAVPLENVVVVATSAPLLAETLHKIHTPDQFAFPVSLKEWRYIDKEMPIYGMRHYHTHPEITDLSDFRRRGAEQATGLAFQIDPKAERARIVFLGCNAKALATRQSQIRQYVYADARFNIEAGSILMAEIDWSASAPKDAQAIAVRLPVWLLFSLGYCLVI